MTQISPWKTTAPNAWTRRGSGVVAPPPLLKDVHVLEMAPSGQAECVDAIPHGHRERLERAEAAPATPSRPIDVVDKDLPSAARRRRPTEDEEPSSGGRTRGGAYRFGQARQSRPRLGVRVEHLDAVEAPPCCSPSRRPHRSVHRSLRRRCNCVVSPARPEPPLPPPARLRASAPGEEDEQERETTSRQGRASACCLTRRSCIRASDRGPAPR